MMPFHAAAFDNQVPLVHALDGSDKDLVAAAHEIIEQHFAFCVADLLQDHLLGGHGADATDRHTFHRLLDVVALFDVRNVVSGIAQQLLGIGVLQTRRIGHHEPAAKGFVGARIWVHRNADVDLTLVEFFGRRGQRLFDSAEHDVAFDVFLARDGIDQHQHFAIHFSRLPFRISSLKSHKNSGAGTPPLEIHDGRQPGLLDIAQHKCQCLKGCGLSLLAHALPRLDGWLVAPHHLPHHPVGGPLQHAAKLLPVGGYRTAGGADRRLQGEINNLTLESLVVRLVPQRPIDARRTHFEAPVIQTFDLQQVLQLPGDRLAVFDGHKLLRGCWLAGLRGLPWQIDRHPEQATSRTLQIHQVKTQSCHGLRNGVLPAHRVCCSLVGEWNRDSGKRLAKKNGPVVTRPFGREANIVLCSAPFLQ